MAWMHDGDGMRRLGQAAFDDAVRDATDALRSEHPPEWHEERLARATRSLWRCVYVTAGLLVVGGLLDLLGVF